MTPWLHIIGFGEGDLPPIPPCEIIIGPERAISRLTSSPVQRGRGAGEAGGGGGPTLQVWRSPKLADMLAQITAQSRS